LPARQQYRMCSK